MGDIIQETEHSSMRKTKHRLKPIARIKVGKERKLLQNKNNIDIKVSIVSILFIDSLTLCREKI